MSSTDSYTESKWSHEPVVHLTCHEIAELKHKLGPELTDNIAEEDLCVILHTIDSYTIDYSRNIVQQALEEHKDDPSIPPNVLARLQRLVNSKDIPEGSDEALELKFQAFLIHDWSIYPEVRSCTKPIDEHGDMDETWRCYALGILWSCTGSALATFFATRFPGISLGTSALQILIMLSGKLLAKLPDWSIKYRGKRYLVLNPGPWGFKEQMITTLTMSVSSGFPYGLLAIVAQQNSEFYGLGSTIGIGYIYMLLFSSQFMGFGIAGLARTFLVYPVQCIWYSVLPTITLNRSLASKETRTCTNGWRLTRLEVFGIFGIVSFLWYFVTNFFFQALGYFDWMAWIAPENVNLQAMTGAISGLAINPLPTFDWNIINQGGMVAPVFATCNQFIGVSISTVAIVILWYTNVRWTAYLPINSNTLFNNKGQEYSVTKVLDSNGLLDMEKLRKYSLPFFSAGNLIIYGVNFMLYPAMFVYACLNYTKTITASLKQFTKSFTNPRRALEMHNDRFSRAQRKHKEVPESWFLFILLASLGMAIATVEHYKFTNTPVWTIFFGVGLATLFTVPFGILMARTNLSLDINVLFEIIIGYAIPGNGNGLMVSKVYATNFMSQTDNYISNQVQAHYTGLAPRALFRLQLVSVVCNTFVQGGILYWQLNGGIENLCNVHNQEKFTCQDVRTYFNASVIWGVIGPKRIFSQIYPQIQWCFLIGAVYPLVFYLIRKLKINPLRNINEMVILGGCMCWSPTNWMYYLPNLYIGLLFNYYIKNKYTTWWIKYNYILNAGLGVGVAYAGLIKFFGTEYTHRAEVDWWGNTVMWETGDAKYTATRLEIPGTGFYGPVMDQLDLT